MHQALKTYEIIDAIFSCLRDYPPEGYHDHRFPWNYNLPWEYNALTRDNIESTKRRRVLFVLQTLLEFGVEASLVESGDCTKYPKASTRVHLS